MSIGYDEIAIEDFYDLFLDHTKKLKDVDPLNAQEYLLKILADKDETPYLIMYIRFLTSLYIKQNHFLFEGFCDDILTFCSTEVEAVGAECDHIQIIAITNYLGVGVEINQTGPKGNLEVLKLPEDEQFDK